ncbi:MAG: secondary thiamine-phosphate synthase enzyme YjbQ [Methanomassiliicoccales archaeon]
MVRFEDIEVSTGGRMDLKEITDRVKGFVRDSGVKQGLCVVHTVHSTAAIVVNEPEGGLMADIQAKVGEDFPRNAGWEHDRVDGNADSHLASTYLGPTRVFPIREGSPVLGTWQGIFLLELDGPRRRTVVLEAMGE